MKSMEISVLALSSFCTLATANPAHSACTNFSGEWRGTCIAADGTSRENGLSIEQKNCDEIAVDNESYTIGSIKSVSNVDPTNGSQRTVSFEGTWDNTGSIFTTQSYGVHKDPGGDHPYVAEVGTLKASIQDGNLSVEQKLQTGAEVITEKCTYVKN
ncbi:MAG: hypothetical protein AB7T49_13120 [Oligoflexales bacterium]